ncbi:helix-turn-helix domain-containing protein [Liquorilactobacillus satsumensis]|uniref:helix-turn-helix domain-containing protein n=1 Tax=Liquorilactobacillus satsumensis TaxID=259059 RepID=UPI001E5146F3|nr:helix-turn-helix domain-containing protein [Liquorilactobacillus satsumensis]MCC7665955.1 hypothetical protein [Liquorilactobacillus satsumensis]MCP9356661.1 helix-turn-helix domain-containing protein [Liquorilactobacillus satsumensis]MCP9370601.1 helix-turn-helix domain-containing protein [Liquorilactobacillus satsumensis]
MFAQEELLYFFSQTQTRRPAVVRQVLANKRTVSNLFWGMQYQILDWLNTQPQMESLLFDKAIKQLLRQAKLEQHPNGLLLTAKGLSARTQYAALHYRIKQPQLFQRLDEKMWEDVLQLLVQVTSELAYANKHYYVAAASDGAQAYFKRWFRTSKQQLQAATLGKMLLAFLKDKPTREADLFMAFFNGHGVVAATSAQLADKSNYNISDIVNLWRDYAVSFAWFLLHQDTYFQALVAPLFKQSLLSNSTAATYAQFLKGALPAQIAKSRKLRLSTINEHLLEAAIFEKNFAFKRLLSATEIEFLAGIFTGPPSSWDYQVIEEHKKKIDFFKFRLFQIGRSKHDL